MKKTLIGLIASALLACGAARAAQALDMTLNKTPGIDSGVALDASDTCTWPCEDSSADTCTWPCEDAADTCTWPCEE